MGTDVGAVFQAKEGDNWIDVDSEYEENRHYRLFSWLAGVRNGYGFAGSKTGSEIKPISEPRGYPDDFEVDHYDEHNGIWMGDHTHSWLLADEILSAEIPEAIACGYVPVGIYKEWDKKSYPEMSCAFASGPNILLSKPDEITEKTSHVYAEWELDLKEDFAYFINEVRRLKDKHGDVRMVFGFDS